MNYRVRFYFLILDSHSILLYGGIFPWSSAKPMNRWNYFEYSKVNIGKIYLLESAMTINDANIFFDAIKEKTLKDLYPSINDSDKIHQAVKEWKISNNYSRIDNVYLDQPTGFSFPRYNSIWTNLLLGNGRVNLYINENKHELRDKKGLLDFTLIEDLSTFFKKEFGFELFESIQGNIGYKPNQIKRFGNVEFIFELSCTPEGKSHYSLSYDSNRILFTFDKKYFTESYIGVKYETRFIGIIRNTGFKITEKDKIEIPIIGDYGFISYSIYVSSNNKDFCCKVTFENYFIGSTNISMNVESAERNARLNTEWAKWTNSLNEDDKNQILTLRKKTHTQKITSSTIGNTESNLRKLDEDIKVYLYNKNQKENLSMFFSGSIEDRKKFVNFCRNLVGSADLDTKKVRIILADPFFNEKLVDAFLKFQNYPVEVIMNSDQQREKNDFFESKKKGSVLVSNIVNKCNKAGDQIEIGSKIIDINKIRQNEKRSFHDRYIFICFEENDDLYIKGFLLSSSISSYLSGTPTTISQLDNETALKTYKYLNRLKDGFSNFQKDKKDLFVKEIWCKENNKNVLDVGKLEKQVKILNIYAKKYKLKISFSTESNRLKIINAQDIDFVKLRRKFVKLKDKDLSIVIQTINTVSHHIPSGSESNQYSSKVIDEFPEEIIISKYKKFLDNLKIFDFPFGLKDSFIVDSSLINLEEHFKLHGRDKRSTHQTYRSIQNSYDYSLNSYSFLLEVFLNYENNDAAISIVKNYTDKCIGIKNLELIDSLDPDYITGYYISLKFINYLQLLVYKNNILKLLELYKNSNEWMKHLIFSSIQGIYSGINSTNQFLFEDSYIKSIVDNLGNIDLVTILINSFEVYATSFDHSVHPPHNSEKFENACICIIEIKKICSNKALKEELKTFLDEYLEKYEIKSVFWIINIIEGSCLSFIEIQNYLNKLFNIQLSKFTDSLDIINNDDNHNFYNIENLSIYFSELYNKIISKRCVNKGIKELSQNMVRKLEIKIESPYLRNSNYSQYIKYLEVAQQYLELLNHFQINDHNKNKLDDMLQRNNIKEAI